MLKQIEYLFKKLLLLILTLLTKRNNSSLDDFRFNSNTKCLLIRLNRIGDALVTTPLIKILKQRTNCKIYLLADSKNYFVFDNNPNIEEVLIYNKGLNGFIETIKNIKSRNFDIVIDTHDDVSTTVSFIIAMTRCNYKYGLEKSNKLIFTHTVPRLDAKKFHVIERITTLLKLTGNEFGKEELKIDYHPAESSIMKIKELLENLYDIKRFLIGINISAGSDARFWGIENYKLLVSKLKEFDINLILICHDKDYLKAKEIIDDKFILNPTKNFDLFAAVIQNLDLLFSPDTSAVFLADAKRIPVFELVVKYRTDEVIWHPFNSDCDFIITKEPTLRNIKFEEVWNKFRPFLQKHLNLRK